MGKSLKVLVVGMLYGVSWMAALSNTFVILYSILDGPINFGPLPTAIMGWALIAFVHHRLGWFPFRQHEPT